MQVVLSHFEAVKLQSNQKRKNRSLIKRLTGVEDYRAQEQQRDAIMKKITVDNYGALKKNIASLSNDDKKIPSTNFLTLLNYLESDDTEWIKVIGKAISNAGE